jgi:hypothetical protein
MGTRAIHDQMTGWLEDALRPELGTLHREFLWQYLLIYDRWAQFHANSPGIDDQESLAQLTGFAEAALGDIASQYPARLWLHAMRSIPLPAFAYIASPLNTQHLMDLVKIATAAACRHGDRAPSMFEDDDANGLAVDPGWLESFKRNLVVHIPRFIGAAHMWYYARGWYRIAGKGAILDSPVLADLKAARAALDRLQPGSIMLVPSATFRDSDEIMRQVQEYDRRTAEAAGSSISGIVPHEQPSNPNASDLMSWWTVRISDTHLPSRPIEIHYPLQNRTLITNSYWLTPDDLTPHLNELVPFAGLMPERLGMTLESFGLCCRAVAATVRNETGFLKLRPLPDRAGAIALRSESKHLIEEQSAARFLFSVMHRGLLRAPRKSWIEILTRLVSEGGSADPAGDVEKFIGLFTRARELDPDLQPSLFLDPDLVTLTLDLLSMNEFFNFCLRKVTTIDDASTPEARRGARFEQSVWQFFRRHLKVDLLVDINTRFANGNVQGEIDVAFRVDGVLVILECKSWQKRWDYFRGDRQSIARRHEQLRRIVEVQIPRNVGLLRDHLGDAASGDLVALVCVAGPEFIDRAHRTLWYGATQRILTPNEILSLISDDPRWRQTVAAARAFGAKPSRT